MTTLSAAIKKDLKQAFPNIKFSVTTSRMDNISVKWELEIGTAATKDAVNEICKKHETVEHHGSNMDDTSWHSGSSVYVNPTCTQERKDWAVKATEARNFVGVVWNETHKHFQETDGRDAFHATKQYREYCDNGVTSDLVDKYGQEPNAKRWYYEKLAKEAQIETPATEPEIIKPELVELPQEVIAPVIVEPIISETDTEKCVRVAKEIWPAMFEPTPIVESVPTAQCLFKVGDRIQHNDKGTARVIWIGKQEIKVENNSNEFFLLNIKSFNKKGWEIIESSTVPISGAAGENLESRPETVKPEIETLTLNSLVTTNRCRIRLTDVRTETVTGQLLDEQDNLVIEYGHPIYVCVRKSETLSLSKQPQPEPQTLTPAAPETNLIPFPSPKQPETQLAAQPQNDNSNDFYLQNYQAWVNKLVARGEYARIKSYEEWYEIAVEVM